MMAAIERGKPVLIEKPIALTVREADQVLAALKRFGGSMRVGYSRRYKERYQIAKEQIVKGRVGPLTGGAARVFNSRSQALAMLKRNVAVDAQLDVDGLPAAQDVIVDPEVGLHVRPLR